jgi:hypothetical protein
MSASLKAQAEAAERLARFREDYQYLVDTGETHSEAFAKRLRSPNVAAMERYMWRHGIPIRHDHTFNTRKRRAA